MNPSSPLPSSEVRPTVRSLLRRNSTSLLPFTIRRKNPTVKSFSTHKIQGKWNTRSNTFYLDLPKGTVDLQMTLTTLDGVYSLKLDEYNNSSEFIPWQDLDYPVWTANWRIQKQFWKTHKHPPYPVTYPFSRRRSATTFYNPARAPHLPQGTHRFFPDMNYPHFAEMQRARSTPPQSSSTPHYLQSEFPSSQESYTPTPNGSPSPQPSIVRWSSVSPQHGSPLQRIDLTPSPPQGSGILCRSISSSPTRSSASPQRRSVSFDLPQGSPTSTHQCYRAPVLAPLPTVCVYCKHTGHTYWECSLHTSVNQLDGPPDEPLPPTAPIPVNTNSPNSKPQDDDIVITHVEPPPTAILPKDLYNKLQKKETHLNPKVILHRLKKNKY